MTTGVTDRTESSSQKLEVWNLTSSHFTLFVWKTETPGPRDLLTCLINTYLLRDFYVLLGGRTSTSRPGNTLGDLEATPSRPSDVVPYISRGRIWAKDRVIRREGLHKVPEE